MSEYEFPENLIKSLAKSTNVTVLTGAGISAESGIKTFRDPDGLWSKFNPAELASMDGFMANPNLVWEWYQYRREIIRNAEPNPGHLAISEMQGIFNDFTLITQNVDRLHQRAGSENVIELHGNIIENYCVHCQTPYKFEIDTRDKHIPLCKECNGKIRPAVVWFGEMLPPKALKDAEYAARNSEFFFTVGTSAEVYPAANLPILAKNNGAVVIEINPNETAISKYLDFTFRYPSGELLPELINKVKAITGKI